MLICLTAPKLLTKTLSPITLRLVLELISESPTEKLSELMMSFGSIFFPFLTVESTLLFRIESPS